MQSVINNRYILHEPLGQGAMGVVYRATDRLSGEGIALKSVTVPGKQLQFASQAETTGDESFRLALAQEFQTLASLRHPHIISVLDYGFDLLSQPYFTMNYLSEASTILDFGREQTVEAKVGLLVQLLQALVYLHRRNILHRDLKPGNVLVTNDRVRVLDFGLSISREEAQGRAGTLAYMAPETLQRAQAVEASDMYAVGVIAYQLFAGALPFEPTDIMGVLSRPADLSKLEADPTLVAIIERLLKKSPDERYASAYEIILALNAAIGQPQQKEDAAVRESFLQAATFVGRDKELGQLTNALENTQNGNGSAWLIGSESGVGKTRLLEELRIRALVQGAQVLRGQASEGQGQPYHIWRAPLRRLSLSVELSGLEAGVLKAIVPDIESIIQREIPAPPELEDKEAAQRLISTIANVIQKAASSMPPLVLLLEDLQWALDSLESLAALSRMIADTPLLVIGTYRTEDVPDLPDSLPDMQTMILQRFDPQAIAALSTSMLGESGAQSQVINLLQNETEGNVFFLVETVRALAEEAGSLQEISSATLPQAVFAGGVQRVIQRRLARVPAAYQPLLKFAAVAGRALEPELLHTAEPAINLENWLTTCANVAVLEIHDERWRFAHDKLRETLLSNLDNEEQNELNLQVSQALEATYIDDLSPYFRRLALHYSKTDQQEQERLYAKLAGEQAAAQYANDEALRFFDQALVLTPPEDLETRYELLLAQEAIYNLQGKNEKRLQTLEVLQKIVVELEDIPKESKTYLKWARYYYARGNYPVAVKKAQQALTLALSTNETEITLETYNQLATNLWRQNKLEEANEYAQTGLELAQQNSNRKNEAILINTLGMIAFHKRELTSAQKFFEKTISIVQQDEYANIRALALNNLGMVAGYQGNFQTAQNYYAQALNIVREMGNREKEAMNLSNLGWVSGLLGEFDQAIHYTKEVVRISREIGDLYNETYSLINLSSFAGATGDLETAQHAAHEARKLAIQIGDQSAVAWALTSLGHIHFASNELLQAADAYQDALTIRRTLKQPLLATEPAAGLAQTFLELGNLATALEHVQTILPIMEQKKNLEGTDNPIRVYLSCYLVLESIKDSDALKILEEAHNLILSRAENISDHDTRKSFLEDISQHQEILKIWQKLYSSIEN